MPKVKEAQRFAEIAQQHLYDRLERYQRLSVEYSAADEYLNEGLEWISELALRYSSNHAFTLLRDE